MQLKTLQRRDRFSMKDKFLNFRITVIHCSSIIHFQVLMMRNKREHEMALFQFCVYSRMPGLLN